MDDELFVNSGFIPEEPKSSDFIAGAETGIDPLIRLPSADWSFFLPSEERQRKSFDSFACVTFSALNSIETQFAFLQSQGAIPESTLKTLRNMGFFDANGKFNASDRFTAKMSNTTKKGNYLTDVWDSIRNHGVLPEEDWKFGETFDWDAYYASIPQALKDKAKIFSTFFDVKYEWVVTRSNKATPEEWNEFLKVSPIHIASGVCKGWSANSIVASCDRDSGHATMMYKVDKDAFCIFDHYSPFKKRLALDYHLFSGMRGVLTVKAPMEQPKPTPVLVDATKQKHNFTSTIKFGEKNAEVYALQEALKALGVFPMTVTSSGFYGEITRKAVLGFQKKFNVAPMAELISLSGKTVGPKTIAKLNELNK